MRSLSRKKILIIGFLIVLLIAIPLTIFFMKQQQQTQSKAEAATTLEFDPVSSASTPIPLEKDQEVKLDVYVNPGAGINLVSNIQLEIDYDPAKLKPGGLTPEVKSFTEDATAVSVLEGPIDTTPGKISVTLGTGSDPTKVIQQRTKVGTIVLTTIDGTGETPTEIKFNPNIIIQTQDGAEQAASNVFAGGTSAFVSVAGEVTNVTTTTTIQPTGPSTIPSPTTDTGTAPSATPSATIPVASITTTVTPSVTATPSSGTATPNTSPVCSALNADRSTTGTAPFAITLTTEGRDSDGTISKVTLSYGDGQVENITTSGGIGTSAVVSSVAHTYQNTGTYTASAILTDNAGGVSSGTCSLSITVNAAGTSGGGSTSTTTGSDASLPPTGPGDTMLSIGAIVGMLSVIGGLLFFLL